MVGPGLDLVLLTPRDMIAPYATERATTIARRAAAVSFPSSLPHLTHTPPTPSVPGPSPRGYNGPFPQAIIPNSLPTAADTKNLSALSNGVEEPMGQARMGGSQRERALCLELGGACPSLPHLSLPLHLDLSAERMPLGPMTRSTVMFHPCWNQGETGCCLCSVCSYFRGLKTVH